MGTGARTPRRPSRRLLVVALGAFLPLAVLAAFAILEAARTYRELDEARLRGTARAIAAAVDAQLGAYIATATTLSRDAMLDEGADVARFEAKARPIAAEFGGSLVIVGPPPDFPVQTRTLWQAGDGRGSPAMGDPQAALTTALARVFEEGRPVVSDLFVGPISGRLVLAVLAPVERGGKVIRAVAAVFEPAALLSLLQRQDLPLGGFATVGDGRYRVLATTADPDGKKTGITTPPWAEPAIGNRRNGLITGPSYLGTDVVYAFEKLSVAPDWIVFAANPLHVQEVETWRAVGWAVGAGVAFLLGLAAVAWQGWRQALQAARQETMALRAGRAEIERLLGGLPAIVFLRMVEPDRTTRMLYRGGDVQAVYGWPPEALPDHGIMDSLGGPDTVALSDYLGRVLREGRATEEWRIRQPDGSWRWLRTRGQVLSRRSDGGAEVVAYIVNIHAERAAAARAATSGRLAALGEMGAGIAHELKQPLAIISLAAENAARALSNGKPGGAAERLDRIAQQAARAGELIEHLRRFARGAEAGQPLRPVPLRRAVEGALALVGASLREASVAVEATLDPPPGPVVMAQLVPLEQVLANLLGNARDAFAGRPPEAPRRVRISSCTDPLSGQVRITVEDTAGGILQPVLDRLFEPFVTTKDAEKGTGLGLSICHGLVRGMGGSIEAHNGGAGAVFTIALAPAPELVEAATPVIA